jgi:hypothetical protein
VLEPELPLEDERVVRLEAKLQILEERSIREVITSFMTELD